MNQEGFACMGARASYSKSDLYCLASPYCAECQGSSSNQLSNLAKCSWM